MRALVVAVASAALLGVGAPHVLADGESPDPGMAPQWLCIETVIFDDAICLTNFLPSLRP